MLIVPQQRRLALAIKLARPGVAPVEIAVVLHGMRFWSALSDWTTLRGHGGLRHLAVTQLRKRSMICP